MTGSTFLRRGHLLCPRPCLQALFPIAITSAFLFSLLINVVVNIDIVDAKTVQLTQSNFDAETRGKSIFIKFCTTSCPHCKDMRIAWEVLEEEWEDNDNIIIGSINCDDTNGKANNNVQLCTEYNVVGTPTVLYGTGGGTGEFNTLNEYAGDMSFSKLNQWAKKVLVVPECSSFNVDLDKGSDSDNSNDVDVCTELEKTRLKEWMALSMEEMQQMIQNVQMEEKNAQVDFDTKMKDLQALYDEMNQYHVLKKASIKDELKFLYSILHKTNNNGNDNDDDDRQRDSNDEL